ncbi:MAG: MarR family transcriptional regulator [Rhizobiales bacterium]|nr:MarR family transcriptional regulator [Hyphomicrobiales bacterium]
MAKAFKLEDFLPYRLNILAQESSHRLSAIYSAHFDLDIPQWRILANLASRGELTAQGIAAITFSHKSTVSRAVAALEGRRLIERVEDRGDRRALVLRLTAKGRRLFGELLPLVLSFEKELLSKLSAAERKGLMKGLAALERELLPREP